MVEYASILILGALTAAVALIMVFANALLGPRRPNPVKAEPFECGEEPMSLPAGRLPVRFYVVAMLFVVFDVELVFLVPWAVLARQLGWFGLLEIGFFLAIVVAGFIYAWKQGALEFR